MGIKTIRPRKRAPAASKPNKKEKSEPPVLEHARYGHGKVVGLRKLDNGDHVATVRFDDGVERLLQLQQQYWLSDIRDLIPSPSKASRCVAEPEPLDEGDEPAVSGDSPDADSSESP